MNSLTKTGSPRWFSFLHFSHEIKRGTVVDVSHNLKSASDFQGNIISCLIKKQNASTRACLLANVYCIFIHLLAIIRFKGTTSFQFFKKQRAST